MDKRSVLVVEDELLIALDIETTLEKAGYRVVGPVPSVDAAMEKIETIPMDLALLDVNLGGGQVFAVADALDQRGIPFAFMTGHTLNTLPDEHRLRPILTKPCEVKTLLAAVAEMSTAVTAER